MIVFDTTVLVYAVGSDHALATPSRRLIEAVMEGRISATTTAEVIQEFTHVRAKRRGRGDAVALARSYVDLLSPLLAAEGDHLLRGLELFEERPALGAFDAVLAAIAVDAGAEALVSADMGFTGVRGVRHLALSDQKALRTLLR